jgi:superfamily II helicase
MRECIQQCSNCKKEYHYALSGEKSHYQSNNKEYCPDCARERIIKSIYMDYGKDKDEVVTYEMKSYQDKITYIKILYPEKE